MELFQRLFKGDRVIWVIFAVLSTISILEFFSSSSSLSYNSADHWSPLTKHLSMLAIGLLVMLFVQSIKYTYFRMFLPYLLGIIAVLSLAYAAVKGYSGELINGASRWIYIPGTSITFQPSEIAKLWLIAFTAQILSRNQDPETKNDLKTILIIISVAIIPCFLIFIENFSTAFLMGLVLLSMLIIGRIKFKYIGIILISLILFAGITYGLVKAFPEQKVLRRAATWVSRVEQHWGKDTPPPAEFDMDKNAQRGHASIAITKGSLFGVGLGNSVQRDFISHAYSDLIFAIILEEIGLIGAFIVILMYLFLLIRAITISKQTDNIFAILLVQGIAIMITLQAIINMAVAVDIIPITGQPLPLISKGGSSMIINCLELGILLSVSCTGKYKYESRKDRLQREAQESEELKSVNLQDQDYPTTAL